MDRHDLAGETAADLASAHMRDLGAQERHGVRFVSYWFDYDRGAAFCLVEAPDAGAVAAVHHEAHGGVAHEIIPVDAGDAARFLGRIEDPVETGRPAGSAFRIILFTDLEGSTAMVQRLGDDGAMVLLRRHDRIVRDALQRNAGREVKHTGDGVMAAFDSVRDALMAALDIQRGFARHNGDEPDAQMAVRIGISAGEPVAESGDLFGAAVQLAARLCAMAEPATIMVAGVVADLAIGKNFPFGPRRPATLQGFPDDVAVCELAWRTEE